MRQGRLVARRRMSDLSTNILILGLVNQIHKGKEDMAQSVTTLAKEIASKSPVAIQGTKVGSPYKF